jgi:hypothetical protein
MMSVWLLEWLAGMDCSVLLLAVLMVLRLHVQKWASVIDPAAEIEIADFRSTPPPPTQIERVDNGEKSG